MRRTSPHQVTAVKIAYNPKVVCNPPHIVVLSFCLDHRTSKDKILSEYSLHRVTDAKIAYNPKVVNENWFFRCTQALREWTKPKCHAHHNKIRYGNAHSQKEEKRWALEDFWNSVLFLPPALSTLSRNHALHSVTQNFDGIRFGHHAMESVFPELGHDGIVGVAA